MTEAKNFIVYYFDDFHDDGREPGVEIAVFDTAEAAIAFARAEYRVEWSEDTLVSNPALKALGIGTGILSSWAVYRDTQLIYATWTEMDASNLERLPTAEDRALVARTRAHRLSGRIV